MRILRLVTPSLLGLFMLACSSSSTPTQASGDGGSMSSCSCSVTYNGVSKSIDCGGQACINGVTFSCGSTGQSARGGTCTSPTVDGGSGSDSGSSGCNLFKCTNTAGCGGIAPCMSTATAGTNYCYEQEGSPAQCSPGTTATTKTTSNGPTTICVPAGCPDPVMFIP